jgi:hypothetical protein
MATLSRNRALLSSLISAVASIGVAFVGILPMLRERDLGTITTQQARIKELGQRLAEIEQNFEVSARRDRWTITGRIRPATSGDSRGKYEVYLVPGNKHLAAVSDDGQFRFEDIFPASYGLVVRNLDRSSSRTVRGLITPEDPVGTLDLEAHGPWADYKAVPQAMPTATTAAGSSKNSGSAVAAAALPTQNGGIR